MKTLVKMMMGNFVVEYPTILERIHIYETLIASDIQVWTPEVEWATLDMCKVVAMTAEEMAWFARL